MNKGRIRFWISTPRVDELDPDIVDNVMIKNAASGVHVLASPSRPENAEKVNADQFTKLLAIFTSTLRICDCGQQCLI